MQTLKTPTEQPMNCSNNSKCSSKQPAWDAICKFLLDIENEKKAFAAKKEQEEREFQLERMKFQEYKEREMEVIRYAKEETMKLRKTLDEEMDQMIEQGRAYFDKKQGHFGYVLLFWKDGEWMLPTDPLVRDKLEKRARDFGLQPPSISYQNDFTPTLKRSRSMNQCAEYYLQKSNPVMEVEAPHLNQQLRNWHQYLPPQNLSAKVSQFPNQAPMESLANGNLLSRKAALERNQAFAAAFSNMAADEITQRQSMDGPHLYPQSHYSQSYEDSNLNNADFGEDTPMIFNEKPLGQTSCQEEAHQKSFTQPE